MITDHKKASNICTCDTLQCFKIYESNLSINTESTDDITQMAQDLK